MQNETADGCKSAIATRQITINPVPTVNAGLDQVVLDGGQVQIKASVSGSSAYKYSWTPGTWLNDTAALQPISMPQADITYTITVTGAGNCIASDEVVVKLLKGLVIPNAFTPNGDGINDKWVIEHLEKLSWKRCKHIRPLWQNCFHFESNWLYFLGWNSEW